MTEEREHTFSEQCYVLCLGYLQGVSIHDSDYDKEDSRQLNKIVANDISSFTNLNDILNASQTLAKLSLEFEIEFVGKVANSVKMIWHGVLSEDNFNVSADSLLENEPIKTWKEVALILQLMYRTLRVRGLSELNDIVELTSKYLTKSAKDFVASQNGWKSAYEKPSLPEEEVDSPNNPEEILTSMVMVQEQEITDENDVPTCVTPPFSIIGPAGDDVERDSLNSATPPEIVDRPPITASLMQIMGAGDASNLNTSMAASSESTDFEMVISGNSALNSSPSSPKAMSDIVVDRNSEDIDKPDPEALDNTHSEEQSSSSRNSSPLQGINVSDYLPQISIGVAAAAACIGLLVLKKSTG